MAVTRTPRLNLERWSSGSDPHPNRAEWDRQQGVLDDLVAIDKEVATWNDRPRSVRGMYLYVRDEDRVYRGTGTGWTLLSKIGGGGAGKPIVVGGTGVEGTAATAARSDHTHPLPLATRSSHGAMSASDKKLLDDATSLPTGNRLMSRDSDGRVRVNEPVHDGDAVTKKYVDTSLGDSVYSTRLTSEDLDTVTTPGTYIQPLSADATIERHYPAGIACMLTVAVLASGSNMTFQTVTTYDSDDSPSTRTSTTGRMYTRCFYNGTWSEWHTHIQDTDIATSSMNGLLTPEHWRLLTTATYSNSGDTLVQRTSSGQSSFSNVVVENQPSQVSHVTRKDYVDNLHAVATVGTRLGDENLDTVTTPGVYSQPTASPVRVDNGYPLNSGAGSLTVRSFNANTQWVQQEWWDWYSNRVFRRSSNRGESGWNQWVELAPTDRATASKDGLMPSTMFDMLKNATPNSTGGTLVQRTAGGGFTATEPLSGGYVANKRYVDDTVAEAVKPKFTILGSTNLDTLYGAGKSGLYAQNSSSSATTNLGYPPPSPFSSKIGPGVLEVVTADTYTVQRYSTTTNDYYVRTGYTVGGAPNWNQWQKLTTTTAGQAQASSERFKQNVETAPVGDILSVDPVVFEYKPEFQHYGHGSQFGLIAERLHEAGVGELVEYDSEGNPAGVDYAKVGVALIPKLRDLVEEVAVLRSRVERLEDGQV